jgi:hypothetical protein
MSLSRLSSVALLVVAASSFELSGCDKLLKKDAATADTSDDDAPKKKKKSDDDSAPSSTASAAVTASASATATASATAEASASASAAASASASSGPRMSVEAMRYDDETSLPDKKRAVTMTAPARKAADRTSDIVVTLQPGNEVTQVAERHEFTLVTWHNKSGDHYGWVETNVAFRDTGVHPPVTPIEIEGLGRPGQPSQPTPVIMRRHPGVVRVTYSTLQGRNAGFAGLTLRARRRATSLRSRSRFGSCRDALGRCRVVVERSQAPPVRPAVRSRSARDGSRR